MKTLVTACALAGLFYGMIEMFWKKIDSKRHPEKYTVEEEIRVKSFFDVI